MNGLQQLFGGDSFLAFTLAHANKPVAPRDVSLTDGTHVELKDNGILAVTPATPSRGQCRVLVSCGIHGNETAPIELVDRLVAGILAQTITVRNQLLIVFGNPLAATRQQRFCEENLNRLFMGRHAEADVSQSLEGQRAAILERFTEQFFAGTDSQCLHYDLHTAIRGSKYEKFAVYPLLHGRNWSRAQLGFLQACGIEAVLLSKQASHTYSYFTSTRFDAHAFTVELGSVKPFGENDAAKFAAIEAQLSGLIGGAVKFAPQTDELKLYSVIDEVKKHSDALQFNFSEDVDNFTEFPVGTVLTRDGDYSYRVKQQGARVVFPLKDVPIGHRVFLVVAPDSL